MDIQFDASIPSFKILYVSLCLRLTRELVSDKVSVVGAEAIVVIEGVLGLFG